MEKNMSSVIDVMEEDEWDALIAMAEAVNAASLVMVQEERNASPVQAEAVNAVVCVLEQVLHWMEGSVFIAEEVEYKDVLSAKGVALNIVLCAKVEEEKFVLLVVGMALSNAQNVTDKLLLLVQNVMQKERSLTNVRLAKEMEK